VLTAQNGPEALSIERAVSRFTDLVMPHGISGGEAGVGLFGKNVAGRRRRPGAAKLRAVLAGEYQTERGRCLSQKKPSATSRQLLAGLPFVPKVAVSGDRE
jgi:hypothetical protein